MKFDPAPQPKANGEEQGSASGCVKIFFVICFIVGILCGIFADDSEVFKDGDRVRVSKEIFVLKKPSYSRELTEACRHKDQIEILQLMYDEKIRMAQLGIEGTVIMEEGGLVEVIFDDDPLFHWWISPDCLTKIK